MINVLLPSMGTSSFFKDSYFPKPMYEIKGRTMLELVVDDYAELEPKNYIFIFSEKDCMKFHVDSSAKIISPIAKVIRLKKETAGALCTCLMAVSYINDDTELIIANSDQIININYRKVIDHFNKESVDAGVITFPNIHPRWSYAKIKDGEVVEVAEKRPLSKSAIAGFYYFKKGSYFVEAAKQAILKDSSFDGRFYISASINELILMNKKVGHYDIQKEKYKSFYSPEKIKEYETSL